MTDEMQKQNERILLLNLLVELQEQCRLAGVRNYVVSGTLLGAVRHKGFIPWDDDIDTMIFSEDYDRLMSSMEKNLGDDYCIVTRENSPLYFQEFPKLCYKNKKGEVSELSIDIFVYTPTDISKKRLRKLQNKMLGYLYHIKRYKVRKLLGKDAGISSPLKKAVVAVFSVIPLKTLDKGVKFFMTVSGKNNGEYVTNWGSQYNYDRKATFKREIFGEPEHLIFEGIDIEVPHDYESMLIQIYGDYMKLPPEDKRVTHGVSLAGCEDVDMETIRARVESKKVKE